MTAMSGLFPLDGFGDAAAAARSEWRADEEAWTSAAVERWLHECSLLDVVRECMHRGDTVSVGFAQRVFSGRVGAVGVDLFSLELVEGRVDVAAARDARFVLRVEARARSGGARGDDVTTMRARLLELETARSDVELGVDAAESAVHRSGPRARPVAGEPRHGGPDASGLVGGGAVAQPRVSSAAIRGAALRAISSISSGVQTASGMCG